MGNIQDPDYETVSAECAHCGALCVFNRIDDIGEPGPYAGRYVECFECREQFWISGDIINPAYQLLVFTARERFATKRYMQCVAILAQAWELFFSLFAYSNYLYRPYVESSELDDRDELFERLSSQLYDATRQFTFYPLRNVLINAILKRVHPPMLQESEAAISGIVDENFRVYPKKADIERFPDEKRRNLLKQLQELKIARLRNEVVHQHAYRPRRGDVEECLTEEIEILYRAKSLLSVNTLDEWWTAWRRRTGRPFWSL